MKANELNIVKMLEIIGKTIENVQTMVSRKGDDIIIVIFFTDGTFTAYSPNPDESVIKRFIEATNMVLN